MYLFSPIFTQALTRSLTRWTRQTYEDASEALKRLTGPFKAPHEPVWAFAYAHRKPPPSADPLTFT